MPHLNELQKKFGRRGLVVVGVTDEAEDLVKDYIETNGIQYPIVIEKSGRSSNKLGVSGIPNAILVDPRGEIVWRGHPASFPEVMLKDVLRGARAPGVELPPAIRSVQRHLDKEAYGKAWADLKRDLEGGRLDQETEKVAREIVTRIEEEATELYTGAMAALEAEAYYVAVTNLERLEDAYSGVHEPEATEAKLAELRADAAVRKAIKAGEKLAQAQDYDKVKEYDRAHRIYRSIARSYEGTRAAGIAAARAEQIEQGGLLGFDKGCSNCIRQGSACPKHKKRG